jgi:ketosteroid isomerase-like protein
MKAVLLSLAAVSSMGCVSTASAHGGAHPDTPKSPVEVVAAFGAALDAGDEAALADLLASDVQIAESGGIERSLEEYRSHHMGADIEFSKAVETEVLGQRIFEGGGLVTILTEAVSKGTFRDKPVNSRLMETMVLKETNGTWKIVHIHWSSAKIAEGDRH